MTENDPTPETTPEPGEPNPGDVQESEPSTPLVEDPAPSEAVGEQDSGTGGTPAWQPGSDADGFGGDAPEPATGDGSADTGLTEPPADGTDAQATPEGDQLSDPSEASGETPDSDPEPPADEPGESGDGATIGGAPVAGSQADPGTDGSNDVDGSDDEPGDEGEEPEAVGNPLEVDGDPGENEPAATAQYGVPGEVEHPDEPSKLREAMTGPTHDELNPLYSSENTDGTEVQQDSEVYED